MKRTTYIFIGVFFANVVLAIVFLVYLKAAVMDSPDLSRTISFNQEQMGSLDLDDVHTFEFTTKGLESDKFYFRASGKIDITANPVSGKQVMSYPVSDNLEISKKNGIVTVVVDLTPEHLAEENSDFTRGIYLDNLNIHIETDKVLKRVNCAKGFDVKFQGIELDSLHMISEFVEIDSCAIRSLALDSGIRFKGQKSNFEDLYINLDEVNRWDMNDCNVNTLYLSGSKKHQNSLSFQYGRLVWEPKNEDAELRVTLRGNKEITASN